MHTYMVISPYIFRKYRWICMSFWIVIFHLYVRQRMNHTQKRKNTQKYYYLRKSIKPLLRLGIFSFRTVLPCLPFTSWFFCYSLCSSLIRSKENIFSEINVSAIIPFPQLMFGTIISFQGETFSLLYHTLWGWNR